MRGEVLRRARTTACVEIGGRRGEDPVDAPEEATHERRLRWLPHHDREVESLRDDVDGRARHPHLHDQRRVFGEQRTKALEERAGGERARNRDAHRSAQTIGPRPQVLLRSLELGEDPHDPRIERASLLRGSDAARGSHEEPRAEPGFELLHA